MIVIDSKLASIPQTAAILQDATSSSAPVQSSPPAYSPSSSTPLLGVGHEVGEVGEMGEVVTPTPKKAALKRFIAAFLVA